MSKSSFFEVHGIVRSAIRQDLLYFAIPALAIFTWGLFVSAEDGWVNLLPTLWQLIRMPRSLTLLSIQNALGLIMFIAGLTIAIIAQITLKRNYSSTLVIREDHQLITHGIYRYTRHPIYLGVIIACIGLPVYAFNLYGLLVMLALIPIFLCRIRMEEKLLIEEFGDAYLTYMDSTKKLLPFIY